MSISYSPHEGLVAKLTSLLKSPKAFGVSRPASAIEASTLVALEIKPGNPDVADVGEKRCVEEGEVTIRSAAGSMSTEVRKEVSLRSSLVDVTLKNMSRSFCWSERGVPFRSRIFWKFENERSPMRRQ